MRTLPQLNPILQTSSDAVSANIYQSTLTQNDAREATWAANLPGGAAAARALNVQLSNQAASFTTTNQPSRIIDPNSGAGRLPPFARAELNRVLGAGRVFDKINLHTFDFTPNTLGGYYLRNDNGDVLRGQDGKPILIWETFARRLAQMVWAVLQHFAFPAGSFWQIQVIQGQTQNVLSNDISFATPTFALVEEFIRNMDDNTTSDNRKGFDYFKDGSVVRLFIYNPSSGQGGTLPLHLREKKRTVWSPLGTHCAAKSLIVCLAKGNKRARLKADPITLRDAIAELLEAVSSEPSWGYDEIDRAADFLGVDVVVFDALTFVVLFDTGSEGDTREETVYLLHDQQKQHFMACFNAAGLNKGKVWCGGCRSLYWQKRKHVCSRFTCSFCHATHDTKAEFMTHFYGPFENRHKHVSCKVCNKSMPKSCVKVHEPECKGIHVKCGICGETYIDVDKANNPRGVTRAFHEAHCGEKLVYCSNCDGHKPAKHTCVITKKDFTKSFDEHKAYTTYVFDMEAMRDEDNHGKQVVTVVSVREVLPFFEGETKEAYTVRHEAFHKDNAPMTFYNLHDFCAWAACLKRTVLVAHNMSGYDGVITHNYMRYVLRVKTEVVNVGLKVMFFKWGSCKMIDSLNHIPSSLAGLPKIVGLDFPSIQKSHFCHKFNTVANHGYKGPLPAESFYEIEHSNESPEAFKAWYDVEKLKYTPHTDEVFDLTAIETEYCHQDTYVLAMCWGEYTRMHVEMTGVDPTNSVTIASTCLKVYRNEHIPDEGIPTLSQEHADFCRRALHGGRTEPFAFYYKADKSAEEREIIRGIDVQSMYPYVMYYFDMPYGEPKVYTEDNIPEGWIDGCGMVECDISPPAFNPDRPYFKPVIGGKLGKEGKYEFNLYPKKREVITLVEARRCVEVGYTISKVYTVYHFQPRSDLFKSYIKTFLKIKVESSNPPHDLDKCIRDHKTKYDIDLDRDKLAEPENAGRRALAKLALNNLWGKLAQRDLDTVVMVDPTGFHKTMARHTKGEITVNQVCVDPHLDDTFSVAYAEQARSNSITRCKVNVAIAAHVTAYGRLRLYDVLGDPSLEGKVLYCDTDCVWFACKEGYKHPEEGEYLGDYEDEAPKGVVFDEFVALAPKMYAVRDTEKLDNPKATKLKCKGFKMSNNAKAAITFDSLRASQTPDENGEHKEIVVEYNHFRRQKYGWLFVGSMKKGVAYDPTTQKSKVMDNGLYIPYGPHTERPEPRVTQKRKPESEKLPPVVHEHRSFRRRIADDSDSEAELSDQEAEALMWETIAEQDRLRNN